MLKLRRRALMSCAVYAYCSAPWMWGRERAQWPFWSWPEKYRCLW